MKRYHVTFYTGHAVKVNAENEKEAEEKGVARMNEIIENSALAGVLEKMSSEDIAAIEEE